MSRPRQVLSFSLFFKIISAKYIIPRILPLLAIECRLPIADPATPPALADRMTFAFNRILSF